MAEPILSQAAKNDVAEAFDWYESKQAGLGDRFLKYVRARINSIQRAPRSHAIVYANFRRALLRRFPYAIFYEVIESQVTIYAIYHTARHPRNWKRRLDET